MERLAMAGIAVATPNWRWDSSPLPTDTLNPPISAPLEWAYLASSASEAIAVCVDAYARDLPLEVTTDELLSAGPDCIVISSSPNILYWRCPPFSIIATSLLVNSVKKAGFEGDVVIIGPHGTHSPEWALNATGADVVWRGSTDVLLAPAIISGALHESAHAYTGGPSHTRIAVDSALSIPLADLAVLDPAATYAPHAWSLNETERSVFGHDARGLLLESTRGCPWSCAYCAKGPVRDRYERRPLELISQELSTAVSLGYSYVFFVDETFNIPSDHLKAVLNLIRKSGLKFGFQGRPDLVTVDGARELAEAGCVYVELGVDVVGDLLSKDMGRRQKLNSAEGGLEACRNAIPVVRFNRLNMSTLDYVDMYPHDTSLTWDIPVDPIYPYPGSPLGEALMKHYSRGTFDWEFAEQYSWWLRIEVELQRSQPGLPAEIVRELQRNFLGMHKNVAAALVGLLPVGDTVGGIHELNKSVRGVGGKLNVRHSGL